MPMSDGERLIAVMLADVMEALKVESELDPALIKRFAYNNEVWALRRKYHWLFDSEPASDEIVKETGDILWMWGIIEHSVAKLVGAQAEEAKDWHYKSYHGFDGNNDPHYHVARTMLDDLGEFESLKAHPDNSHSQTTLRRYRAMYAKFMGYVNAQQASPLSFEALRDLCS